MLLLQLASQSDIADKPRSEYYKSAKAIYATPHGEGRIQTQS